MLSFPVLFSHSSALTATQAFAAIRSFFSNSIVALNAVAANASFKFICNKIFITTSLEVFSACHWFKMLRVNAASVSAKMIKVHSIWNWSYNLLITKSVRRSCFWTISLAAKCKVSIPGGIFCTNPFPTIITANALNNLCPEPIWSIIHKSPLCGHSQSVSQRAKEVKL
jgi:hypothetical protein